MSNKLSRLKLLWQIFRNHGNNDKILISKLKDYLTEGSKYPRIVEAVDRFLAEMIQLKIITQFGEEYHLHSAKLNEYILMINFDEGKSIWNN